MVSRYNLEVEHCDLCFVNPEQFCAPLDRVDKHEVTFLSSRTAAV